MCIGDWRVGRLIRAVQTHLVGSAALNAFTLPQNPQRVGVSFFSCNQFSTVTFNAIIIPDGLGQMVLPQASTGYHFTLLTHGDLPTHKFTFAVQGDNPDLQIIEYFLPEEFLQAGLEEFKREYNFPRI